MNNDQDLKKFFSAYQKPLLPQDGERFMKELKRNMDCLPEPAAFDDARIEASNVACRKQLEQMKRTIKKRKREWILVCVLASILSFAFMAQSDSLFEGMPDTVRQFVLPVICTVLTLLFVFSLIPQEKV